MNTEIIFENKIEEEATEKVLGAFKTQKLNENMDVLLDEILKYAKEIDTLMNNNGYETNYLDTVSNLSEINEIKINEEINDNNLNEILEDLVKRINTRIKLLKESNDELNKLSNEYKLDNMDINEEIEKANLV